MISATTTVRARVIQPWNLLLPGSSEGDVCIGCAPIVGYSLMGVTLVNFVTGLLRLISLTIILQSLAELADGRAQLLAQSAYPPNAEHQNHNRQNDQKLRQTNSFK